MEIKQFIEKAIAGGWGNSDIDPTITAITPHRFAILLDPLAWQAVGKVEGWTRYQDEYAISVRTDVGFFYKVARPATASELVEQDMQERRIKHRIECAAKDAERDGWKLRMHAMIDHLAEGGTIESYLETL